MKLEENSTESAPAGLSDDELRAVLDEAERRKDAELSRTGRKVSLVICIPILLVFAWAGVFLLRYHASADASPTAKPAVAAEVTPRIQDPQEMAELKAFLPPALRGEPSAGNAPAAGPVVNHEDIRFAMELLNYCRPSSAWKDEKVEKK